MLRHDAAHLVIDPIMAPELHEHDSPDCFVSIDIDDCDCGPCLAGRGPLAKYTTLSIGLMCGTTGISQRLTAKEARRLADTLLSFAQVIDDVAEVGNEVEDLA